MKSLDKLKLAVEETIANEEMSSEQKQEALMTILHNSTQLYMEMLKVNLQLKSLPTQNINVITKSDDTVVM